VDFTLRAIQSVQDVTGKDHRPGTITGNPKLFSLTGTVEDLGKFGVLGFQGIPLYEWHRREVRPQNIDLSRPISLDHQPNAAEAMTNDRFVLTPDRPDMRIDDVLID